MKRLLSGLLSILILLSVMPFGMVVVSAVTYNASSAVSFANSHWNDGVGLCAEFVSRCLSAGGIQIPNSAYYSTSQQSYQNNSGTLGSYRNPYTCSAALLLYLSQNYPIISNPSSSQISVGDVVFMYGGSSGQWKDGHVGIVISTSGGIPVYAAHNKATNTGKFSSSYPCTYVAKMNGLITTHKVDSSYGTSFTAYPKAKITASDIFDAYHNQISSTAWIGTSDLCTIHEVYTDGCCKVSYPLDSGGTETVYSKISLFDISHTCNKGTYMWYEAVHPHCKAYKCSICDAVWKDTAEMTYVSTCDDCLNHTCNKGTYMWYQASHPHYKCYKCSLCEEVWVDNKSTTFVDTCLDCQKPGKSTIVNMKNTYNDNQAIKFEWTSTTNTTHYNVWIGKKNSQGEWERYDHLTYVKSGVTKSLPVGEYCCNIQSYNSNYWFEDGSDWLYTESETVEFRVVSSSYLIRYNANGGTGAPGNQLKSYGKTLVLSDKSPVKNGYEFLGWSINPNATVASYSPGELFTIDAVTTLYAVWKPNVLTVYYNANGAKTNSSTYGVSSNVIYTLSDGEKLKHIWTYNNKLEDGLYNASTFGLTKTGYTFKGWGTTSSGETIYDQDNANLVPTDINANIKSGNCSTMLYAIWTPNTYKITFNANGGTGVPKEQTKTHGKTLVLSNIIPEKDGYTFMGWSSSKTATKAVYNAGDDFKIDNNTVLYAVWKQNVDIVTVPSTTEAVVHPTEVTTESVVITEPTEATTESTPTATELTETTVTDPSESKPVETTVTEPAESELTSTVATLTTNNVTESTESSTSDNYKPTDSTEYSTPDETKPSEPTEDKGILGDVNGDGKVNIKDATQIQKFAAKLAELTEAESLRADVNGDSKVNVKDATVIQKYVAKLETGFLVGEPIVLKENE